MMPAALTSASTPPNACTAALTTWPGASSVTTSACTGAQAPPACGDGGLDLGQGGGVAADRHDGQALLRQAHRGRAADARGGSGDDGARLCAHALPCSTAPGPHAVDSTVVKPKPVQANRPPDRAPAGEAAVRPAVGASIPRVDGEAKVRGTALYVDDLPRGRRAARRHGAQPGAARRAARHPARPELRLERRRRRHRRRHPGPQHDLSDRGGPAGAGPGGRAHPPRRRGGGAGRGADPPARAGGGGPRPARRRGAARRAHVRGRAARRRAAARHRQRLQALRDPQGRRRRGGAWPRPIWSSRAPTTPAPRSRCTSSRRAWWRASRPTARATSSARCSARTTCTRR